MFSSDNDEDNETLNAAISTLTKTYKEDGGSVVRDDKNIQIKLGHKASNLTSEIDLVIKALKEAGTEAKYESVSGTVVIEVTEKNRDLVEGIIFSLEGGQGVTPYSQKKAESRLFKTVKEAHFSGRVLFRGDTREPTEMFEGFKLSKTPKDDKEVITGPFTSKPGSVYALTPYLNTAAMFPTEENFEGEPYSWVYIVKIYTGVAIASASMKLVREGRLFGALDYPAETITDFIPPEHIIGAVKIKRHGFLPENIAAQQPESVSFNILDIVYNSSCTENIDASLQEYLSYLKRCQEEKIKLPMALASEWSSYWKSTSKGFPEGLGLRDVAQELIALNSKDFPAKGVKYWCNLIPPVTENADAAAIDQAAKDYPNLLRLLNPQELVYLLKRFPTVNEGSFFSTLKEEKGAALLSILKNNRALNKETLLDLFIHFINKDKEGVFIPLMMTALESKEMSWGNLHVLLHTCSESGHTLWSKALLETISQKIKLELLSDSFNLPSSPEKSWDGLIIAAILPPENMLENKIYINPVNGNYVGRRQRIVNTGNLFEGEVEIKDPIESGNTFTQTISLSGGEEFRERVLAIISKRNQAQDILSMIERFIEEGGKVDNYSLLSEKIVAKLNLSTLFPILMGKLAENPSNEFYIAMLKQVMKKTWENKQDVSMRINPQTSPILFFLSLGMLPIKNLTTRKYLHEGHGLLFSEKMFNALVALKDGSVESFKKLNSDQIASLTKVLNTEMPLETGHYQPKDVYDQVSYLKEFREKKHDYLKILIPQLLSALENNIGKNLEIKSTSFDFDRMELSALGKEHWKKAIEENRAFSPFERFEVLQPLMSKSQLDRLNTILKLNNLDTSKYNDLDTNDKVENYQKELLEQLNKIVCSGSLKQCVRKKQEEINKSAADRISKIAQMQGKPLEPLKGAIKFNQVMWSSKPFEVDQKEEEKEKIKNAKKGPT